MGLDVYLYRYHGDEAAIVAAEKAFDEKSEAFYEDGISDDERDMARTTLAESPEFAPFKMDKWGTSGLKETISLPSTKHPDDICQIGYFRSSYNSSGMNSRLRDAIGKDLYWVFDVNRDDYHITPDWDQALVRVKEMIAAVNALIAEYGNFEIMEFSPNPFITDMSRLIGSTDQASEVYKEHYEKNKTRDPNDMFGGSGYSNSQGAFFLNSPIQNVKAVMAGYKKAIFGDQMEPCTYLIVESTVEEGGLKWPLQSLDVVQETIEWVLAQDDRKSFVLHWSA